MTNTEILIWLLTSTRRPHDMNSGSSDYRCSFSRLDLILSLLDSSLLDAWYELDLDSTIQMLVRLTTWNRFTDFNQINLLSATYAPPEDVQT